MPPPLRYKPEHEKSLWRNRAEKMQALILGTGGTTVGTSILGAGMYHTGRALHTVINNLPHPDPALTSDLETLAFAGFVATFSTIVGGAFNYASFETTGQTIQEENTHIKAKKNYQEALRTGNRAKQEQLETQHKYLTAWADNHFPLEKRTVQYTLDL